MVRIIVVGAGVMAVSTAYLMKRQRPDYEVTIVAEKFTPNTTSDGAAGLWKFEESHPGQVYGMRDTPRDLLRELATATWNWYMELLKREDANLIGISRCSGYDVYSHPNPEMQIWHHLVPDCRRLNEEELKIFPEVVKFREAGGLIVTRKIHSFEEVSEYDVVVNCTGLGAKDLCNDKRIQPMRGQVVRVKAPWIKHFYFLNGLNVVYIFPNIDNVVLGATSQLGVYNCNPDDADRHFILTETAKFVPSLQNAEFIKDWVGLRPSREEVRLEKEDLIISPQSKEKKTVLKVVHNYGHGPSGITMHWGSAQHAVKLIQECIRQLKNDDTIKARL